MKMWKSLVHMIQNDTIYYSLFASICIICVAQWISHRVSFGCFAVHSVGMLTVWTVAKGAPSTKLRRTADIERWSFIRITKTHQLYAMCECVCECIHGDDITMPCMWMSFRVQNKNTIYYWRQNRTKQRNNEMHWKEAKRTKERRNNMKQENCQLFLTLSRSLCVCGSSPSFERASTHTKWKYIEFTLCLGACILKNVLLLVFVMF